MGGMLAAGNVAKSGEWGMGALGFQFVSAEAAHAWVHAYYNAFVKRRKRLADYKTNPNSRGFVLHVRENR